MVLPTRSYRKFWGLARKFGHGQHFDDLGQRLKFGGPDSSVVGHQRLQFLGLLSSLTVPPPWSSSSKSPVRTKELA